MIWIRIIYFQFFVIFRNLSRDEAYKYIMNKDIIEPKPNKVE